MRRLAMISLFLLPLACSERNPLHLQDGSVQVDGAVRNDGALLPDQGILPDQGLPPDQAVPADQGPPPPDLTPGSCTADSQCGPNQFCDFATGCGATDPGTCKAKPQACPMYFAPVCGCDGKDYDSPCFAASAGVSVKHTGKCTTQKTCNQLNQDYVAAIQQAKACSPMAPVMQCQIQMDNALHCACPIYVEQGNTTAIQQAKQIKQQFNAQGCVPYQCGMPCPVATQGNCAPDPSWASGTCK